MSRKRQCTFTKELQAEFPFLKQTKIQSNVRCESCNGDFSIASGGKNDITRHTSSDKHKRALLAAASSAKVSNFFRKTEFGTKEKELAIAEAVYVFHTMAHNQTFRSLDCTSKLVRGLFEPKFSCARTKAEAIVKNVFAPYTIQELLRDLENIKFLALFTDSSNHKDIKLFPVLIRYFDSKLGVQLKLLDFVSLPGETSILVANAIFESVQKHKLQGKVAAFCGDNAFVNFGGLQRRGTNNVYSRLKDVLKKPIVGVGCTAHIVHNTIQVAADQLPVDIEGIIIKIYGHFHIYTVRVASLKEFCEEADVEYMKLLGYSKTRWLALMPAVERVLKLFSPLKSYFLSIDNCPRILQNFFEDDGSEMWLYFIHNQAALFQTTVKSIEGDKITMTEVVSEISSLKFKLSERLDMQYLPPSIRSQLKVLESNGWSGLDELKAGVNNFYNKCIQYLDARMEQFDQVDCFNWVCLNANVEWQQVMTSYEYVSKFESNVDLLQADESERELLDEFTFVKKYADEQKIKQWKESKTATEDKWIEIFNHFECNNIPFKKIKSIVEFALCLPGTNAVTERLFSVVNKIWTSEKTQLTVETLKAILQVRQNFSVNCEEFLKKIATNDEMLKQVHSAEKYM